MEQKKFEKAKFVVLLLAVLFGGLVTIMGAVYASALFFLVAGFFLGKYSEKLFAAIKDYRLSLKLDRVHWSQVEFESMKKERDALRATLAQHMTHPVVPHRPGERERPPAVGYHPVDEAHYMYRGVNQYD